MGVTEDRLHVRAVGASPAEIVERIVGALDTARWRPLTDEAATADAVVEIYGPAPDGWWHLATAGTAGGPLAERTLHNAVAAAANAPVVASMISDSDLAVVACASPDGTRESLVSPADPRFSPLGKGAAKSPVWRTISPRVVLARLGRALRADGVLVEDNVAQTLELLGIPRDRSVGALSLIAPLAATVPMMHVPPPPELATAEVSGSVMSGVVGSDAIGYLFVYVPGLDAASTLEVTVDDDALTLLENLALHCGDETSLALPARVAADRLAVSQPLLDHPPDEERRGATLTAQCRAPGIARVHLRLFNSGQLIASDDPVIDIGITTPRGATRGVRTLFAEVQYRPDTPPDTLAELGEALLSTPGLEDIGARRVRVVGSRLDDKHIKRDLAFTDIRHGRKWTNLQQALREAEHISACPDPSAFMHDLEWHFSLARMRQGHIWGGLTLDAAQQIATPWVTIRVDRAHASAEVVEHVTGRTQTILDLHLEQGWLVQAAMGLTAQDEGFLFSKVGNAHIDDVHLGRIGSTTWLGAALHERLRGTITAASVRVIGNGLRIDLRPDHDLEDLEDQLAEIR